MRPPAALLREAELRLAQEARRLGDLVRDRLRASGRDLATACARLLAVPRDERLRLARQRLETDAARLEHAAGRRLEDAATGLGRLARLLDSLSPTQVLDRGYAIVRATSGAILPTLAAALPHRDLVVHFADGRLPVRQTGGAAGGRAPNATSRAKQGELL
jgi:exodeoxyribonuclease VII large subunit